MPNFQVSPETERMLQEALAQSQGAAAAAPSEASQASSVAEQPSPEGGKSWYEEVVPQAVRGVQEALNETSDLAHEAGQWLNENVVDLGQVEIGGEDGLISWKPGYAEENDLRFSEDYMPDAPETFVGGLVNDTTQFLTDFIGAGKFLKGWKAASKTGKVTKAMTKGAIADFAAFDPHEDRLSNLVEQYPALANPVTEYLAADEEDSVLEGRFKNAVEGMGLGALADGLMFSLKALKAARKGNVDEAVENLEKAEQATPKAEQAEAPKTEDVNPGSQVESQPGTQFEFDLQGGKDSRMDTEKGVAEVTKNPEPGAPRKLPFQLDDASKQRIREAIQTVGKNAEIDPDWNVSGGINIKNHLSELSDPLRVFDVHNAIRTELEGVFQSMGVGKTVSLKSTRMMAGRLADTFAKDPELFTQRMFNQAKNVRSLHADLVATNSLRAALEDEVVRLTDLLNTGQLGEFASEEALVQRFDQAVKAMTNLSLAVDSMASSAGRALNAAKIGLQNQRARAKIGLDAMTEGGVYDIAKAREIAGKMQAVAEGNPHGIWKVVRPGNRFWDIHNEFWINALLSGPKTHVVNSVSNMVHVLYRPAENVLAGAIGRDKALRLEGMYQYVGMKHALKDATKAALHVLRYGENILDPLMKTNETDVVTAIGSGNKDIVSLIAGSENLLDVLGNIIRMPSRALAAEDEFFKQVAYRSKVFAMAMSEAKMRGLPPTTAAKYAQDRVEQALQSRLKAIQEGMDPTDPLDIKTLQDARETTFSQELGYGFGQSLQQFTGKHPWMRTIFPFIRTPTNLIRFTWQRTPVIGAFQKQMREDLAAGGRRRAQALARQAMGLAFVTSAVSLAMEGRITGYGPRDPDARREWLKTHRPYAFKMVNEDGSEEFISFERMDPFGMFFGIVADVGDIIQHGDEMQASEAIMATVAAIARNLTSKTYLKGLQETINVMDDPERYFPLWVNNRVASYVPAFFSTFKMDPASREVRSVIDAVKNRIPGLSDELDPRRNVLGEVVTVPEGFGPDALSPFAYVKWKDDKVAREIARLEHGFQLPPPILGETIDLREDRWRVSENQTAYDRYQELVGTVRVGGKTLKEFLDTYIASPAYERMTDNFRLDGYDVEGSKVKTIRSIIGMYRKRARAQLLKENPKLMDAYRNDRMLRARAKVDAPENLQDMLN
jgi:hypothetical protein